MVMVKIRIAFSDGGLIMTIRAMYWLRNNSVIYMSNDKVKFDLSDGLMVD
jgi:hypothetical protein